MFVFCLSSRLKMENRESGCLSVKTDTSVKPPIGLEQEGVHRLKLERRESASSGFLSMKSDESKEPPILFKEDSSHRLKPETSESVFSDCLSVETDQSKEHPTGFSEDTSHSAQTSMADESVDASRLEEIRPQNTEHCFRLLLAGNLAVGKTCLLQRFLHGIFPARSNATIGFDFADKVIKMYGKTVRLKLFDMSGLEKRTAVTTQLFRGTHGFIIVYDVASQDTFDQLKTWLWDIETRCDDNAFKVLVGNKNDLTPESRVDSTAAQELASEREMPFIETSALTGENVDEAFLTVTRAIMKHRGLDQVQTEPAKASKKCLVS
ncbi:ras-related protein Rab-1B-like isoform X2 [Centroberyx affinis]|uniref:ras-related protein Rab-1B-like isoform X2 n=1 Tax=Centroberyx affinis TaxID=166261 RepID=UPI003A5BBD7F